MKLQGKSAKQSGVSIEDYYAFKVGPIWRGFKQEGAAFWWLCIFVFFEYVRPQQTWRVLDVLPWAQISLLLAVIFALADRNTKWVSNPGNVLFMLFVVIIFLSGVFAFKPAIAWDAADIIESWILLYFLIITVVNTEKRFLVFVLLFFLVNFRMSQFGFRSFLMHGYSSFGVTGAPGWFRDSGDLGVAMTIFVALSAAYVLALHDHLGRYKKLLFYLLPVSGLLTIIQTSSRGAQLGIAVAVVWFLLKSRNGFKGLAVFLLVGWALYALLPERMIEEFEAAGEDNTSQQRLELWRWGLEVVVPRYPVLGAGYNNWLDYCRFLNPNGLETLGHCHAPHNTMVQAISELGILGLTAYLALIIFIFVTNARTRRNAKQINSRLLLFSAHGLDGGLIAYLVGSFFFTQLYYPMFYVQLGMTVALYEISKKQLAASRPESKRAKREITERQKDVYAGNGLDGSD